MPAIDRYFEIVHQQKASDLHLTSGSVPLMRRHGKIQPVDPTHSPLEARELERLLLEIAPEANRREFEATRDTDFAYELGDVARFRANLFRDRTGAGGVFRLIPKEIVSAEQLNLSRPILDLCLLNKGLVLVTGPTGSGKSTTLAAMVDWINRNRSDHILTIEDPIEFVHANKRCLVNQREVGTHSDSFKRALRAALREDPNIILVGEMRDLETVSIALELAETGHLVLGTLHTTTAASTVDRIIDQFPADRQAQVRTMLAESLRGVIAQNLLRRKDGSGRVAAMEVLLATSGVSANIREGKTHQIPLAMQTGRKLGMVDLGNALLDLVTRDVVEPEEAYLKAVDKPAILKEFERLGISWRPGSAELAPAPAPKEPAKEPAKEAPSTLAGRTSGPFVASKSAAGPTRTRWTSKSMRRPVPTQKPEVRRFDPKQLDAKLETKVLAPAAAAPDSSATPPAGTKKNWFS